MPAFATGNITDTIAAAGNAGSGFKINGSHLEGIKTPSGWTTSNITFEQSDDGTTWRTVVDSNNTTITIPSVVADRYVVLPASLLGSGADYLRARSTTAQASQVILTYYTRTYGR